MKRRAVWVTGLGAFTPLGATAEASGEALRAGASCRKPVDFFSTEGCRCREASPAPLAPEPEGCRGPSRATRLALPALGEALEQAGLWAGGKSLLPSVPLSVSTTGGAMAHGESFLSRALQGKRRDQFRRVATYQPQYQMLELQAAYGLDGPVQIVANACASGANAIGHGYDLIRSGRAEVVVTGGYEALTDLIFTGFDCLQALSTTLCRPFDTRRDGLMLGEGAAFLVLESEDHAKRRGARALARVMGYGHSTDLHHLTQPAPDGSALVRAMESALACEESDPAGVGYLNAHGTGTPMNDGAEAAAYARVRDGRLMDGVVVSSTKAAVGHTLGAAGAIEAVFALQALATGLLPPQLNLREPVPELAGRLVVHGGRMPRGKSLVMSVNLGFGGSNAALLFGPV